MRVYIFEWTEDRQDVRVNTRNDGYEISIHRNGKTGQVRISAPEIHCYGYRSAAQAHGAMARALAIQQTMLVRPFDEAHREVQGYWVEE